MTYPVSNHGTLKRIFAEISIVICSSPVKAIFTITDKEKPFQSQPRPQLSSVQIGELNIRREGFIGRRAAIRKYYRNWAEGKTALAGYFARRWQRQNSRVRIFAFSPPFELTAIEEQLRPAFLECAAAPDIEKVKVLNDCSDRLQLMLSTLTEEKCVFIFDNIETCLDLETRRFLPQFRSAEQFFAAVINIPGAGFRSLLTCRYPMLCQLGNKDEGLPLLRQALEVGQALKHPQLATVEALLQQFEKKG